jgi:hypothetical protein
MPQTPSKTHLQRTGIVRRQLLLAFSEISNITEFRRVFSVCFSGFFLLIHSKVSFVSQGISRQ